VGIPLEAEPELLPAVQNDFMSSGHISVPFSATTELWFTHDHRGPDVKEGFRKECRMVSDEALLILQEQNPKARDLRKELWCLTNMLASITLVKNTEPNDEEQISIAKSEAEINRSIHKAL
jgi:hypothetical protein